MCGYLPATRQSIILSLEWSSIVPLQHSHLDLPHRSRMPPPKFSQNPRMDHSQSSQLFVLADHNWELLSWEEEGRLSRDQSIIPAKDKVGFLENQVQSTMDNREEALLSAWLNLIGDDSCQTPQVSCSSICSLISNDAVTSFEELEG